MKRPKALASIAIASMALTLIPFNVFAAGAVPTRISGYTAEQTAVKVAEQTGWTGTAILASSTSYGMVDALTVGPLATFLKAPILLTGAGDVLNPDTEAELIKLKATTVFVTSGTGVISQAVLDQLTGMGITIVPLGGADRFATAANIANKMAIYGANVSKVALAYGWNNQDALSIAAIASAQTEPILLTEKDSLPSSVAQFLTTNTNVQATDVIGGSGVISDQVLAQLPNPTRHYGDSAYDTNLAVLKEFDSVLKYDHVFLANGETAIDALAGAPLAAKYKAGIVLTQGVDNKGTAYVGTKLNSNSIVTALGGTAVVPEIIRTGIASKAPAAVGGGGGGGGGFYVAPPPVVNNPAVTTADVSDAATLNAAVNNANITKITLTKDVTQDLIIPRSLTLDLGAYTLHGNVTFQHTLTGTSSLIGTAATSIDGNLTVDTPNASFENNANVRYNVNIVNVKVGTWTEQANGNTLIITDDDGAVITIVGSPGSITVSEDADNDVEGILQITINPGQTIHSITLNSPAEITVSEGATVTALNVGAGAYIPATATTPAIVTTVTNNGIVPSLTANAPINLVANKLPDKIVTGANGSITATGTAAGTGGSAVQAIQVSDTTAPVLSSTSASNVTDTTATLNFSTNEAGTYYYLVYAAAAPAPDAATIKAQGSAIKGTGPIAVEAKTVNLTGLTASTAYRSYVVIADAAENLSSVSMIGLTTIAPVVPPVVGAAVGGLSGVFQVGEITNSSATTTEVGAGGWTSSVPAVATVDGTTGKITPLAAGSTTISYTISTSGLLNSKTITVYPAAAVVNPIIGLIHVGSGAVTPTGFVVPVVGQTIEWMSSAPNVATINSSTGAVTPVAVGNTTISYAVKDTATGRIVTKGSLAVAVPQAGVAITGLDVPAHVLQLGDITTTTAQAIALNLPGVTWTSSQPSIAMVDGVSGVVTALSPGSAIIAYSAPDGRVNSQQITVYPAAVVANPTIGTVRVGSSDVIPTGFTPPGPGNTISWTSSDPSKASVDEITGAITPILVGPTTISYAVKDYATGKTLVKGSKDITVEALVPGAVTGVTLDKQSIILMLQSNPSQPLGPSSVTLNANVLPSDAVNKTVTWSSDKPQFATVDSNGTVTAVKVGEITHITVTTIDGNYSTTCSALVVNEAIAAGAITQAGGAAMADAIALYGPALGLNLTTYSAISLAGQAEVQSALSYGTGFTTAAQIQAAIDQVIALWNEPMAPAVTADVTNNTVVGMVDGLEYSLDGEEYHTYNSTTFGGINLSGDHTMLVRWAALSDTSNPPKVVRPASADTELLFRTSFSNVDLTSEIISAVANTSSTAIMYDITAVPSTVWVTPATMAAYTTAIDVAKAVNTSTTASAIDIDTAYRDLNTATLQFNLAKSTTDTAIRFYGVAKLDDQAIQNDYPNDLVAFAQDTKLEVTQPQVNDAVASLALSSSTFNLAKADGTLDS